MKKGFFRRGMVLLLAAVMVMGMSVSAFAADGGNATQVTIADGDTPYISFGADLRADEKAKVLELFGLTEADLEKCNVNTVTNAEEHQYLDAYITNDHIGSRALSSVAVMKAKKGSGITVTTKNINYCTTSMYENALATAGVKDANVVVVGPFDMSGTAALIGAVKAYSGMTGEAVDTDVIDGAINEMVVTGEIGDEILAERTVEQLKYIHAVYDLAKEKGYIQDATFTGMKHRMEQENMQRSEKVARGEAVYGLKEYTLDLYQEYELSMIEEAYILDETNEGMGLTEEEIEAYYNTRDWIVGEDARKADLSEARAAVIDEMRRNRYKELTEQKAAVAEVDGDMDQLSQFTLKQL